VEELRALSASAAAGRAGRTDRLRFLLAYLGLGRLTPAARWLVQVVQANSRHAGAVGALFGAAPAHRRAA
jgi:hypothetical protein